MLFQPSYKSSHSLKRLRKQPPVPVTIISAQQQVWQNLIIESPEILTSMKHSSSSTHHLFSSPFAKVAYATFAIAAIIFVPTLFTLKKSVTNPSIQDTITYKDAAGNLVTTPAQSYLISQSVHSGMSSYGYIKTMKPVSDAQSSSDIAYAANPTNYQPVVFQTTVVKGYAHITSFNLATGQATVVTQGSHSDENPTFSTANQLLAYDSYDAGSAYLGITITDPLADTPAATIKKPDTKLQPVSWSPDGRYLLYSEGVLAPYSYTIYDTQTKTSNSLSNKLDANTNINQSPIWKDASSLEFLATTSTSMSWIDFSASQNTVTRTRQASGGLSGKYQVSGTDLYYTEDTSESGDGAQLMAQDTTVGKVHKVSLTSDVLDFDPNKNEVVPNTDHTADFLLKVDDSGNATGLLLLKYDGIQPTDPSYNNSFHDVYIVSDMSGKHLSTSQPFNPLTCGLSQCSNHDALMAWTGDYTHFLSQGAIHVDLTSVTDFSFTTLNLHPLPVPADASSWKKSINYDGALFSYPDTVTYKAIGDSTWEDSTQPVGTFSIGKATNPSTLEIHKILDPEEISAVHPSFDGNNNGAKGFVETVAKNADEIEPVVLDYAPHALNHDVTVQTWRAALATTGSSVTIKNQTISTVPSDIFLSTWGDSILVMKLKLAPDSTSEDASILFGILNTLHEKQ